MKTLAALVALAATLALAPAAFAGPASVTAQNELELPILIELNRVRTAHGLAPVRTLRPLRLAADAHAGSMGRLGYFSHPSADGTNFDRRLARFYAPARFRYWTVGENLSGPPPLT